MRFVLIILITLLLACSQESSEQTLPEPAKLTREATGYYTQMIVADSVGPKAQIWLSDKATPIWFTSVRNAIKFTRTPEEADNILGIYVNPVTDNYQTINHDNWINLNTAVFVVNSQQTDGMGLAEVIPFADEASAQIFIQANQGELVIGVENIVDEYLMVGL